MSPFRGSYCVKMAKIYSRSTFLARFYLIMSVFFLNYIVLWNMFSEAHFQHFIAIVPYFGPFQGVMFCKNGPKILQIDISCRFWPNNVWNFFITLFYDIFLVEHIFNIFLSFGAGRGTIARRTCYSKFLTCHFPQKIAIFAPFIRFLTNSTILFLIGSPEFAWSWASIKFRFLAKIIVFDFLAHFSQTLL